MISSSPLELKTRVSVLALSINARDAIDKNGQLSIRTHNESLSEFDGKLLNLPAGDYVLLSVTDTGSGMNAETKDKIFDPFFSTKGSMGTGLGLSQVYGFVQRSQGAIKVNSAPSYGSRFILYFPRSHQATTIETSTLPIENHLTRGTETLLVVDDEPALAALAKKTLSAQGYRVLTVDSGERALSLLQQVTVDLIISDVIMPGVDGYQFAAQVRQRYPHIKIQMVSGFTDDYHNHTTDEILHQEILNKPYTAKELLSRVRKLLDDEN